MRIAKLVGALAGALIASALVLPIDAASAQPGPGGGRGPGAGWGGFGPGMMMGPGAMGRFGMGVMCSPQAAGFAAWRIERIEQAVKPTDAQKASFDALKAASAKAQDALRAACPTEVPATAPARMEAMEKRLDAMLQAVKTVRPAFDEFYKTLSDEQKARLNSAGPRRWRFWRWG